MSLLLSNIASNDVEGKQMEVGFFPPPETCSLYSLTVAVLDSGYRKHLSIDMCPYTCVLDRCNAPEMLYTTKAEWKEHMLQSHSMAEYLVCFACADSKQYNGKGAFAAHVREAHKGTISEDQIDTLLDVCRRTVPAEITACPLCPITEGLEGVDGDSLIDHISDCVHSFSLRALPWPPNAPDEEEVHMHTSVLRTQYWLKHLPAGGDPASWRGGEQGNEAANQPDPSLQEDTSSAGNSEGSSSNDDSSSITSIGRGKDKKSKVEERCHYFRDNPYFAESSAGSSSGSNTRSITSIEKALDNMRSGDGNHPLFSDWGAENNQEPDDSQWQKAEELGVQVMETYKMKRGADHPSTIISMVNLASIFKNQDRWKEAEELEVQVMALLLDPQGEETVVTKKVVKAVAGRYNGKAMELVLNRRGSEITITEEVVKAAAGRYDGKVMELLLNRRGSDITITEEVVKAAAGNSENGKEVIELLLDRRGSEITITEEVVKAAAGNSENGKEVMELLLDRRGSEITITEEVVKVAAGNSWKGKEVMELFLDRRGSEITITEEVVKAAAGNPENGKEVMELLLDRRGKRNHYH